MVPQFCFLVFVVSTAAAVMNISDVCEQAGCGDYNVLKERVSEGKLYFYRGCDEFDLLVSEDKKNVTFEYDSYAPDEYEVQEDGCLKGVSSSSYIAKGYFSKIAGTCDEVFLYVTCYDDGDGVIDVVSTGASTECLRKALDKVHCKYGRKFDKIPGLENATCT